MGRGWKWAVLAIWLWVSGVEAAFEQRGVGARPVGMGGAYVALADGPNGIFWNPAGVADLSVGEWSSSYSRPFGLSELSHGTIALALPTRLGSFALGLQTYGFSLYKETTFILSYGRKAIEDLSVGANVRGLKLKIENFGSGSAVAFDVGFIAQVDKRFNWGMCVWNIGGAKMGKEGEKLGQALSMGICFEPAEGLLLSLDVRKEMDFPLQVRTGMEYSPYERLFLRAGVGGNPSSFAFGVGVHAGRMSIDYASYNHLVLGLSYQISLNVHMR